MAPQQIQPLVPADLHMRTSQRHEYNGLLDREKWGYLFRLKHLQRLRSIPKWNTLPDAEKKSYIRLGIADRELQMPSKPVDLAYDPSGEQLESGEGSAEGEAAESRAPPLGRGGSGGRGLGRAGLGRGGEGKGESGRGGSGRGGSGSRRPESSGSSESSSKSSIPSIPSDGSDTRSLDSSDVDSDLLGSEDEKGDDPYLWSLWGMWSGEYALYYRPSKAEEKEAVQYLKREEADSEKEGTWRWVRTLYDIGYPNVKGDTLVRTIVSLYVKINDNDVVSDVSLSNWECERRLTRALIAICDETGSRTWRKTTCLLQA